MANPGLIENVRLQLRAKRRPKLKRVPRMLYPAGLEREYARFLRLIVGAVLDDYRDLYRPLLEGMARQAGQQRGDAARDSWVDDLDRLHRRLVERTQARRAGYQAAVSALASRVAQRNLGQWQKAVKGAVGVDLFASEPWLRDELRSWAQENAQLITTLEDRAVNEVATWTQRGLREGQRHEEIGAKIAERFGVERRRANLLARDQTAKLNAGLTEQRQTDIGVDEYTWRTSQDERVRGNPSGKYPDARPSHHVMEGKRCRWDDPAVYRMHRGGEWLSRSSIGGEQQHPGHAILCRCDAEPVLDHLLEAT
jgi:SPP1 gp7 family putative phage head morphogenesis protein